jgi:hypothetical protein
MEWVASVMESALHSLGADIVGDRARDSGTKCGSMSSIDSTVRSFTARPSSQRADGSAESPAPESR